MPKWIAEMVNLNDPDAGVTTMEFKAGPYKRAFAKWKHELWECGLIGEGVWELKRLYPADVLVDLTYKPYGVVQAWADAESKVLGALWAMRRTGFTTLESIDPNWKYNCQKYRCKGWSGTNFTSHVAQLSATQRLERHGTIKHAISVANSRLSYFRHVYHCKISEYYEKLNETKGKLYDTND